MMHWLLLPLIMAAGAITFRIRGGLLEDYRVPGQLARASWAAACSATALAAGAPWWVAVVLLLPLAWAATTLPLFGAIDMGHNEGSVARDLGLGTLHGNLMGLLVALPLAWVAWGCPGITCGGESFPRWWLVLPAGAAWGVIYWLAWRRLDWPEIRAAKLGKTGNPPEAGELGFGALFALALFIAATP